MPFEEIERRFPPDTFKMFIAVGYSKVNKVRAALYAEAKSKGYELVTYVSSKCNCCARSIGHNCFIFEDNTIQPFVTIGNDVVIWSGSNIGHHSTIGDHCFFASYSHLRACPGRHALLLWHQRHCSRRHQHWGRLLDWRGIIDYEICKRQDGIYR